jgi:hypothetical protein
MLDWTAGFHPGTLSPREGLRLYDDKPLVPRTWHIVSLGIFDVNKPLIYGERSKAVQSLQGDIVKRNGDTTIFAWDVPQQERKGFLGLLAPSQVAFAVSAGLTPYFVIFGTLSPLIS